MSKAMSSAEQMRLLEIERENLALLRRMEKVRGPPAPEA